VGVTLMRNLEFKARDPDPRATQARACAAGAELWGDLRQTDTYFRVARGRLKLRETPSFPSELIFYERDEDGPDRPSDYLVARGSEGAALAEVLRQALGETVVVRKRRTLLLLDTVRIHLDNVDTLGSFVEIEVPVTETEAAARDQMDALVRALSFSRADCIRTSYADLVAARQTEITRG
jgi:adenylate cyclase class IV